MLRLGVVESLATINGVAKTTTIGHASDKCQPKKMAGDFGNDYWDSTLNGPTINGPRLYYYFEDLSLLLLSCN